jgi:hypothetical protein
MGTLVRRLFKTGLFVILFFVSLRYIYTPFELIPAWNQHYSFVVSESLGFRDIELFDVLSGTAASLVIAAAIYILLVKCYRYIRAMRQSTQSS